MSIQTLVFDLDDTLYPVSSGIWGLIGERIELFIHLKLGLPLDQVHPLRKELFTAYGTTMRGLVELYDIDEEEYLKFVHDVPIEERIHPDAALISQLTSLPQKKVIFTNADERHARRVMAALNVEAFFDDIIDIHKVSPYCKPQAEAFHLLLKLIDSPSASSCVVIDDFLPNIKTAQSLGFHALLAGENQDHSEAFQRLQGWDDLSNIIDQLNSESA